MKTAIELLEALEIVQVYCTRGTSRCGRNVKVDKDTTFNYADKRLYLVELRINAIAYEGALIISIIFNISKLDKMISW